MAHPLVDQLRFTRSEFTRGLRGLDEADAQRRLDPMNCISWCRTPRRVIYHYWFHTGENAAIRQMLGHDRPSQFVGSIDRKAPYRPDRA